jgi:hypothetical protein
MYGFGNIPIKLIETAPLNRAVFSIDSNINKREIRRNTGTSFLQRMGGLRSPSNIIDELKPVYTLVGNVSPHFSYGVIVNQNII